MMNDFFDYLCRLNGWGWLTMLLLLTTVYGAIACILGWRLFVLTVGVE